MRWEIAYGTPISQWGKRLPNWYSSQECSRSYSYHHCSHRHTQVVHLSVNEVRDCLSGTPAKKAIDWYPSHHCLSVTPANEARYWYSSHHCSRRHTQVVHLSANEVRDCLCGTPTNQSERLVFLSSLQPSSYSSGTPISQWGNKFWHFGPRFTQKAISAAVNGSNFGKSIISKYLRVTYDLKNKKIFGLSWKIFSFRVVLGLRGIIVAPPILVQ